MWNAHFRESLVNYQSDDVNKIQYRAVIDSRGHIGLTGPFPVRYNRNTRATGGPPFIEGETTTKFYAFPPPGY